MYFNLNYFLLFPFLLFGVEGGTRESADITLLSLLLSHFLFSISWVFQPSFPSICIVWLTYVSRKSNTHLIKWALNQSVHVSCISSENTSKIII
jgi:hypothetical protein